MNYKIIFLLCITLSSCQKDFLKVVSSSFAKEYCSCLYVEKLDSQSCEEYAAQSLKVDQYHHDQEKKLIVATGFGYTSSSYYQNEKLGCSLP